MRYVLIPVVDAAPYRTELLFVNVGFTPNPIWMENTQSASSRSFTLALAIQDSGRLFSTMSPYR
jgi:hypothetical protein